MYQGLLAIGKIPEPKPLERILEAVPRPILLVAVDALANAENLGALVRNCVGFGTHALIVGETSSSPFLRRAVRSSMGTVFDLPIVETPDLVACLSSLKKRGVRCIAAHPHVEGRTLSEADFTKDCCIIFGSEGHGITRSVLELCDDAVAIPMPPTVDSLNVGSAAAIFLYEANRQRSHRSEKCRSS
jgi:tRNA G18 (ribose-2'-O)-methylase SpoU